MKPAAGSAWQLVLGPSLWALWFVVAYGGAAVACSWAPPDPARGALTAVNAVLLALALATAALLAWLARRCHQAALSLGREPVSTHRRFLARLSAWLHGVAAASTLVVALPLLLLPPCL